MFGAFLFFTDIYSANFKKERMDFDKFLIFSLITGVCFSLFALSSAKAGDLTTINEIAPDSVAILNGPLSNDSVYFDPDSVILDGPIDIFDNYKLFSFRAVLEDFNLPYRGKIISHFGNRRGRMHTGTDIKLNRGDTIVACFDGIVSRASSYYGYGKMVVLDHTHQLQTYYAHLSTILVKSGDTIRTGQPIGLGGRTGRATTDHLHFEIRENGKAYNSEMVFDYENGVIRPEVFEKENLAELFRKPAPAARENRPHEALANAGEIPAEYIIKAGDSLWKIARRFSLSVSSLCELNNMTTTTVLKIGNVLKLY